MPVRRQQPQTLRDSSGGRGYGYGGSPFGGRTSSPVGGFGPDANALSRAGERSYQSLYERIRQEDERNREEREDRPEEQSPVDSFFHGLYQFGSGLAQGPEDVRKLAGADDPFSQGLSFVASLPLGTFGAMPQGAAQAYEAISGRGVADDDEQVQHLDASQQVASGVNAAINLVGPWFGGSGSMLRGGGRAIRAGIGALTGEAAEGAGRKAAQEVAETGAKGLFRTIAGEAAEEAGEEFVQSLADDARNQTADEGSLGRAAQSAALGALGGGIMSGAGYGLNRLAAHVTGQGATDGTEAKPQEAAKSDLPDANLRAQAYGTGPVAPRHLSDSAREVMRQRSEGASANWPASGSMLVMPYDNSFDMTQSKMGTQDVRSIFYAPDNGRSAERVAEDLGMSVEDATAMFEAPDWEQRLTSRVTELRDAGTPFKAWWARNPATKGRQPIQTDVVELFPGRGVMLHPTVVPYVGADADGDKMFATFNSSATENASYVTDLLVDPETGQLALDGEAWARSGIGLAVSRDAVKRAITGALEDTGRTYRDRSGREVTSTAADDMDATVDSVVDDVMKGVSTALGDEETGYADIARALVRLRDSVNGVEGSPYDGGKIVADAVFRLSHDESASFAQAVRNVVSSYAGPVAGPDVELGTVEPTEAPGVPAQGRLSGPPSMARLLVDMNMVTYAIDQSRNSPFRQNGQMGMIGKALPSYIDDARTALKNIWGQWATTGKMENIIVSCLNETSQGGSVENSIESLVNGYVVSRTLAGNGGLAPRGREERAELYRRFVENRNESIRMINEADKILTTMGVVHDFSHIEPKPLTFSEGQDFLADDRNAREFVRIMRTVPMAELFDVTSLSEDLRGLSLGEMIDYSNRGYRRLDRSVLRAAGLDSSANEDFNRMRDASASTARMVSAKARDDMESITRQLAAIASRMRDGALDPNDRVAARYLLDVISQYVGPDAMYDVGMVDYATFLNSEWGQELASGDVNRALNAVVSLAYTGQYRRLVLDLAATEPDTPARASVVHRIQETARIDELHAVVANQLLESEDGYSQMLDVLTSLDVTYDEKVRGTREQFVDGAFGDLDVLVSAMRDRATEFDMTDINSRRRKASQYMRSARMASYDDAIHQFDTFSKNVAKIDDYLFESAMDDILHDSLVDIDYDSAAMMLYDATFFGNESIEKATIEVPAQQRANAIEVQRWGGPMAVTEKMVDAPLGRVSMHSFATNHYLLTSVLSGAMDGLYVYDPDRPWLDAKWTTRDSIFAEACGDGYDPHRGPTKNNWLTLLGKNPQLMAALSPQRVVVGEVSGSPVVGTGTTQSLSSMIEAYRNDKRFTGVADAEARRNYAKARRRIRNRLNQIPGLLPKIATCIPGIENIQQPSKIKRELVKVMDEIVDYAMYRAMNTTGGIPDTDAQRTLVDQRIDDFVHDVDQIIASHSIMVESNRMADSAARRARKAAESNAAGFLVKNIVARQVNVDVVTGMSLSADLGPGIDKEAIKAEARRVFDDTIGLHGIMLETFGDAGVVPTLRLSDEMLEAIDSTIDASTDIDDQRKAELKAQVRDNPTKFVVDAAESSGWGERILRDADVIPATKDPGVAFERRALDRIHDLITRAGQREQLTSGFDDDVLALIRDRDTEKLRALKNRVNNMTAQRIIGDINLFYGSKANKNMLGLMMDVRDTEDKILRVGRAAVAEVFPEGTTDQLRTWDVVPQMPRSTYNNPYVQALVTKLTATDVAAGEAPLRTGVNGIRYRTDVAYGMIDSDAICAEPPRALSSAELADFASITRDFDLSEVRIARPIEPNTHLPVRLNMAQPGSASDQAIASFQYDPNGRGETWVLGSLTPEEIRLVTSGSYPHRVHVFVPTDCSDGLCCAHQHPSLDASTDSHLSIKNVINRINQHAQEAMSIQLKKKPGALDVVGGTQDWARPGMVPRVVDVSGDPSGTVSDATWRKVHDEFAGARRAVTDSIAEFLADKSMKALHFGRRQATVLANNVVVGMRLGFERPDESVFYRVAPKGALDNSAALQGFVQSVVAEEPGAALATARVFESTFTETAMRGMTHVMDSPDPKGMSDEQLHELMREGMTDLSRVGREEVSMADILAAVEPVGDAHSDTVIASNNPSRVIALMDEMAGQRVSSLVKADRSDDLRAELTESEERVINGFNRINRLRKDTGGTLTVTKVFVSGSRPPERYRDTAAVSRRNRTQEGLISELTEFVRRGRGGIASLSDEIIVPRGSAIALDPDAVYEAISWSKRNKQPVAVPVDLIRNVGIGSASYYTDGSVSARLQLGDESEAIDMALIYPYLVSDAIADVSQATSKNVQVPDVFMFMESLPGMSMIDGSSLYNSETVGTVISDRSLMQGSTVRSITGGNVSGATRMATTEEVGRIAAEVAAGDLSHVNLKGLLDNGASNAEARQLVSDYLSWFVGSSGDDVTRGTASSGWVVSMLATTDLATGEVVLTPVTLSESGPDVRIRNVLVEKRGDMVHVSYDAGVSLGDSLSGDGVPRIYGHKIAMTGVSYKSMGMAVEPGRWREVLGADMPKTMARVGGQQLAFDGVIDRFALASRMADISPAQTTSSIWYFTRKVMPVNAYLEPDGNGGLRLREHLRRMMVEQPNTYTRQMMISLIQGSGDQSARAAVESGEITLSDDPETNRLIQSVAMRSGRGSSLNDVLTSFSLTPEEVARILTYDPSAQDPTETFGSIPLRSGPAARDIDFTMILNEIGTTPEHRARLFNFIDPRLIPRDEADDTGDGRHIFSYDGKMYVKVDGSNSKPLKVRAFIGPVLNLGKTNQEGTPSAEAKRGAQMRASQALDMDMNHADRDFFLRMFAERTGRADVFDALRVGPADGQVRDTEIAEGYQLAEEQVEMARETMFDSPTQREYRRKLRSAGQVYERFYPVEDKRHDRLIESVTELSRVPEVASATKRLNEALRGGSGNPRVSLSPDVVNMLVVTSASDLFIEGRGQNSIPLGQYVQLINDMADNIEAGRLPIVNRVNKKTRESRVATALLPQQLARHLWGLSPRLRQTFGDDFSQFRDAMMQEQQRTREITETQRDEGKKRSIYMLNDWLMMNWGERPNSGHVWGETSMRDIIASDDVFIQAVYGKTFDEQQVKATKEMSKRNAERIAAQAAFNDSGIESRVEDEGSRAGFVSRYDTRQRGVISGFLRNASELSKFMSMLNPFISAANVADRVVHQGFTDAMMQWSMNNGVGPYKSNFVPDQNVVRMGARSNDASKVFDAIFYASIDGNEAELMSSIHGMQDIDNYLAQRRERMESDRLFLIPRKAVDAVFEFSGGGKVFQDRQISIWFNQFSRIISSDRFASQFGPGGVPLLTRVDGGRTILEQRWEQDPGMLLAEVFSDRNNPYYVAARQALNASRAGEATQANIMYSLYQAVAKRSPAFEFFSTTFVSKFMLYSTNMAGRVLNLVAPMSAVNYLATDLAARRLDPTGRLGFEEMQMYTSFREALAVDAMHMAPAILALVVGMIPGLLEPPEDEDKRGNPDEWTIMGMRIGDDWLISDIMGLGLPLATFFASARTGDMRFDLLWNGITQACYSNPVLKASTAVEVFFDPESSFHDMEDQFNRDQEAYADAPGGSPDPLTWMSGQLAAGSVSYLSQFVTPSFVRELLTSYPLQQYEVSYKLVEQMDERGQVVVDPDTGLPAYQAVSYTEAQIRRITRNQPVMGLLADIFSGAWLTGRTGYTGFEMPRTVYYDDAQLESMRMFSVNDENGDPLPADQQQEKVLAVLSVLMANDDMEELAASGFYIDYDTRMMVGDTIHDILNQMAQTYSEMRETGQLDYYVLGNGDFSTGQAIGEQIKQDYYAERDFWNSLYYDKLWSEPLATRLTTYNRYNTTYARDDNGEVYATGQYRSINPLFWHAPGTLADGTPTAGWENDWNSVSAVTGQAMDQRALIPTEAGRLDVPDIDSLGDDSNDGWSASWPGYAYSRSTDGDGYGDGYGYGGSGGGYRRSYGRRSYGRGGGGGGYSPSIYSRLPNVYAPSAKTMYAERVYGPNYDYLRPNFETKGSREAYKRSDI